MTQVMRNISALDGGGAEPSLLEGFEHAGTYEEDFPLEEYEQQLAQAAEEEAEAEQAEQAEEEETHAYELWRSMEEHEQRGDFASADDEEQQRIQQRVYALERKHADIASAAEIERAAGGGGGGGGSGSEEQALEMAEDEGLFNFGTDRVFNDTSNPNPSRGLDLGRGTGGAGLPDAAGLYNLSPAEQEERRIEAQSERLANSILESVLDEGTNDDAFMEQYLAAVLEMPTDISGQPRETTTAAPSSLRDELLPSGGPSSRRAEGVAAAFASPQGVAFVSAERQAARSALSVPLSAAVHSAEAGWAGEQAEEEEEEGGEDEGSWYVSDGSWRDDNPAVGGAEQEALWREQEETRHLPQHMLRQLHTQQSPPKQREQVDAAQLQQAWLREEQEEERQHYGQGVEEYEDDNEDESWRQGLKTYSDNNNGSPAQSPLRASELRAVGIASSPYRTAASGAGGAAGGAAGGGGAAPRATLGRSYTAANALGRARSSSEIVSEITSVDQQAAAEAAELQRTLSEIAELSRRSLEEQPTLR